MLRIRVAPAMLAVLSFAAFPLAARGSETRRGSEALAWPAVTRTCRPWTYWWWMGSAVTPEELTRHLEMYRAAGMGGCHIVPIYGAKGCEEKYIPFLSPEWMEVLAHTVAEARRLDMGIDMTTGTGWPFGGPNVGAQDAAARVLFERYEIAGGWRVESPIRSREQPKAALRALMAYPDAGDPIDLAAKVGAEGKLDWTAPPGRWRLIAVFQGWTEQQVKRAAPGGEGNVLDYFSRASLARYLERFDEAFAKYTGPPVRAFYNDSYEVYRANWTDDLFDAFTRRRGYDLRAHLPALLGDGPDDLVRRVRSDYRRTAGDLLLDAFTIPWVAWAHAKGSSARSQAHGSPANILDLYAACDIPETEAYGPNWIIASGGEVPPGIPPAFGGEADVLGCKFASSAAHVAGKPLVGCESCTWLSEHFRVSLAQAKAEIDLLFACGVNHVVFHGMTYSPREVSWPGWLFYAATNFGPSNTFWKDLPALNAYIARAQSFLQNGRPDADVLLYFPFSDLIAQDRGSANLLQYMQVHNTDSWFRRNLSTFHAAATRMWERGYLFDFVSDRQLDGMVAVEDGALRTPGGSYRALVIAGATILPPRTREAIDRLRGAGAKVLTAGVGDIETLLAEAGVPREPIADMGIRPIRRVHETGRDYFLANQGEERLEGWVPLGVPARAAVIFDPYHGTRGVARIRAESRRTEVYLQLDPGDAIVLRALERDVDGPPWPCFAAAGSAHEIRGAWTVEFIEGGPELPAPMRMEALESWAGDEPEGVHAGMNPAGIAIGDLDGDRIPDLAVANYGSEGISIFAGRAGGTFHAERRIAVGKSPMGLVAEDLDGDGDLDLAVCVRAEDRLAILRNDGRGSFAKPESFGAGTLPLSVTAGDLDGDGDLDLATANGKSNDVSILLADGKGSFAPAVACRAGAYPHAIRAVDLDGDGDIDLATANASDGTITILANDGRGGFAPARAVRAGEGPKDLAIADLDGDGDPDIATADYDGGTASILRNRGRGVFDEPSSMPAGADPRAIACADLDGDGRPDLAVANWQSGDVAILRGSGDGTFGPARRLAAGPQPCAIAVADLDGDRRPDLAVACHGTSEIAIFPRAKEPPRSPARAFSGTARYTITFRKPDADPDEWILDLGRVCESARVTLNGESIGTLIAPPFRLPVGRALRDGQNRLEIEVTNLMANRIAEMDRRGVPWCTYFFVYITGAKSTAAWRPLASGLLGPVALVPMRSISP